MNALSNKLKTGSETLNEVVRVYFIPTAKLNEVIIGNYHFKDTYHNFLYSLREYTITHSKKIEPYESLSCRKLLILNNISMQYCRELIINVNQHLLSQTDVHLSVQEKRLSLEKSIQAFVHSGSNEEDPSVKRMCIKIYDNDEFQLSKNTYLDSVLNTMKDAEVNQVNDNEYIVINKLLNMYTKYLEYMHIHKFKEKRKYLKKCDPTTRKVTLQNYVKDMLYDEYFEVETIQWFFTYLVYGYNKVHILFIHSILGYKYHAATKLYQKLFCKDHTTGKDNDFLYHSDYFNLTEEELYNDKEIIAKIKYTPTEVVAVKEHISKDSNLSYLINDTTITIYDSSHCYDKFLYEDIVNRL